MAVISRSKIQRFAGLRSMEPLQDLRGVADLIEEAFADDLDHSGQTALRELRWLSYLKPILWWMVIFGSEHDDFLSGFVWEEERKIVGNITINRLSPSSRRWLISNVAVSKTHRRRGIARGLMYAAVELVKEYQGESVSLQVRADNALARRLYQTLGFKEISGTTHLQLKTVPQVKPSALPAPAKMRPRHFDAADARQAYQLASAVTSPEVQQQWPLRQSRFRLDQQDEFFNRILHKLMGSDSPAYWVVENGQSFVATLTVRPGLWGSPHQIELMVHPDWRGYLEKSLIGQALAYLQRWPNHPINIKHPDDHTAAIEAYRSFGFELEQTLLWMKLDF